MSGFTRNLLLEIAVQRGLLSPEQAVRNADAKSAESLARRGVLDEVEARVLDKLFQSLHEDDRKLHDLVRDGRLSAPAAKRLQSLQLERSSRDYVPLPDAARELGIPLEDGETSLRPAEVVEAERDPKRRYGRYVSVSKLGEGGMGEVWKAWDKDLRRWVALKLLKGTDAKELERFRREARTAARLSHPSICAVHDVGEAAGRNFIAMQYIQGSTLSDFPRSDVRRLAGYLRDAAAALHVAHEAGIVHRDIKPDNLMIESGPNPRIVVMDFGLARNLEVKDHRSSAGMLIGTPFYMSPEQAERRPVIDRRTDVYSLGAALYEILAGRPPFQERDLHSLLRQISETDPPPPSGFRPDLPRDLETIVLKCLEKDPKRRYATALELSADLTRWLEGEPILAHPPSTLYRLGKFVRRKRSLLGVALVGAICVAMVAAILIPRWRTEARGRREKEAALAREENRRRTEREARDRARPHLDAGRSILARLDRLLTTPDWKPQSALALAEEARGEFRKALETCPEFAEAMLETARAYAMTENRAMAIQWCTRAIESSPEFATAYLERASVAIEEYEEMRHRAEERARLETPESLVLRKRIEADLETVKRWSRDRKELRYAEGMFAFAEGNYGPAAKTLEEFAELNVADPRGREWAGHCYIHLPGKEGAAIPHLAQAIQYRPRNPRLYLLRALALTRSKNPAGAIEDCDRVLAIVPHSPNAYTNRGLARKAMHDYDGAVRDYTRAIDLNPRDGSIYFNRGLARLSANDSAGALADFTKALKAEPNFPQAWSERGRAKAQTGDYDGAIQDCTTALGQNPGLACAYFVRGFAFAMKGEFAQSLPDFDRAIELDPEDPQSFWNRASARLETGNLRGSFEDYSRAMELDPKNPEHPFNRGRLREKMRDWKGAILDYSAAIDLRPTYAEAWANRAWNRAKLAAEEPERAKEHLREAAADYEHALKIAPPNWRYRATIERDWKRVLRALQ